jgi:hypothetical protein
LRNQNFFCIPSDKSESPEATLALRAHYYYLLLKYFDLVETVRLTAFLLRPCSSKCLRFFMFCGRKNVKFPSCMFIITSASWWRRGSLENTFLVVRASLWGSTTRRSTASCMCTIYSVLGTQITEKTFGGKNTSLCSK